MPEALGDDVAGYTNQVACTSGRYFYITGLLGEIKSCPVP